ncbi:MAG: GGDEF domain-containing protein [Betaproteobacteria bacterium]|nr:GGDEF domain-containing protein [Betaproteobacteria bacterium]MCH9849267.1 GGDEF domain-containing protein [Betaproteobacteria bacterium]
MDAKQQYILTKKINLLYLNSFTPAIMSGIIELSLAAILWHTVRSQPLLIWLGITLLLTVIRVSLFLYFKKHQPTSEQLLKWEIPYAISLFLAVLNWSIGLLIIIPIENLNVVFIISIFSISLATGATSWYGQIRYMQLGTVCLFFVPTIVALLTHGEYETLWLGITAGFIFLGCLLTCHLSQKTVNDHFELAYELKKAVRTAKILAHTDVLTGLNNRRAFFEIAPKALSKCKSKALPISLITFDIDYFKKINDAFGHAAGDIALERIASLLTRNLRTSDVCCRLGGEEFAVQLPNISLKKAIRVAEKFRKAIMAMPIVLSRQKSISITASFGVSDIGDTIDNLLNHADQAMYKAKNNGRNLVVAYAAELSNPSIQIKTRKSIRL